MHNTYLVKTKKYRILQAIAVKIKNDSCYVTLEKL